MAKITTKPGKKGKGDKKIFVDGHLVTFGEVAEQVKHLVDIHGEERVRKELEIPLKNHRRKHTRFWDMEETKEIIKELSENEERIYPRSEGKSGSGMLKDYLSREIFRHEVRKRSNNSSQQSL